MTMETSTVACYGAATTCCPVTSHWNTAWDSAYLTPRSGHRARSAGQWGHQTGSTNHEVIGCIPLIPNLFSSWCFICFMCFICPCWILSLFFTNWIYLEISSFWEHETSGDAKTVALNSELLRENCPTGSGADLNSFPLPRGLEVLGTQKVRPSIGHFQAKTAV